MTTVVILTSQVSRRRISKIGGDKSESNYAISDVSVDARIVRIG